MFPSILKCTCSCQFLVNLHIESTHLTIFSCFFPLVSVSVSRGIQISTFIIIIICMKNTRCWSPTVITSHLWSVSCYPPYLILPDNLYTMTFNVCRSRTCACALRVMRSGCVFACARMARHERRRSRMTSAISFITPTRLTYSLLGWGWRRLCTSCRYDYYNHVVGWMQNCCNWQFWKNWVSFRNQCNIIVSTLCWLVLPSTISFLHYQCNTIVSEVGTGRWEQKHCICIKMAYFSWHKMILRALAVLITCTTYTKEDGYVDVTMFTEIGGEGSKIDYRKRGRRICGWKRCPALVLEEEEVHTSIGVLPQAYQTQVKANALKKADLLKLCKYIPNDKCAFYDHLCTDNWVIVRNI